MRTGGASEAQPVTLAEIAARQEISQSYLEQLFGRLRRAGLVRSARGPGGGYRLARPAAELRIADIVVAVDENLRATRCPPDGRHGLHEGREAAASPTICGTSSASTSTIFSTRSPSKTCARAGCSA